MPSRPFRSPTISLAACAVPAALLAAMAAWSAVAGGAQAAAETGYLAVVAAGVLLAVAGLAPRAELWLGAPLVVLAAWVLPPGPERGAVVTALLTAVLVVAGGRRLTARLTREGGDPAETGAVGFDSRAGTDAGGGGPRGAGDRGRTPARQAVAAFAVFLPLTVGAQILCRGERLLAPASAAAVAGGLVVLPLAAAAALAVLAGRFGALRAVIAGAAVAVLAPGFNVATTVGLVAVAVGAVLPVLPAAGRGLFRGEFSGTGGAGWSRWAGGALGTATTVLIALTGVATGEPRSAAVAVAAGAVATGWPAAVGVGVVAALGLAFAVPLVGWREAGAALAWVVILLPALPGLAAVAGARRGGPVERPRSVRIAAAVVLALAAARAAPALGALAAPVALLALLALPADRPRSGAGSAARSLAGALTGAQGAWSAVLLAATALLATYPWLRREAATAALDLVGLRPGWTKALVLAVAIALAAAAAVVLVRLWARWRPPSSAGRSEAAHSPAGAGPGTEPGESATAAGALGLLVLVAFAVGFALPWDRREVVVRGAAVDAAHPRLAVALTGGPVAAVRVESALANATDLLAGTRVATVALVGGDGRRVEWTLTAGRDTGEWAARRPDVAAAADLAVPPAWISWAAVSEGRAFFAQRYLRRFASAAPLAAERLEVVRDPTLPAPVRIDLHRLEVER